MQSTSDLKSLSLSSNISEETKAVVLYKATREPQLLATVAGAVNQLAAELYDELKASGNLLTGMAVLVMSLPEANHLVATGKWLSRAQDAVEYQCGTW